MSVNALREKRLHIAHEMRKLVEEKGGIFTPEEQQKFDQMEADESSLKKQIDYFERVDGLDRDLAAVRGELQDRSQIEQKKNPDQITRADQQLAFKGWALHGTDAVTPKMREAARKCGVDLSSNIWRMRFRDKAPRSMDEARDWITRSTTASQAIGTTSVGKEAMIIETMAEVETQLAAYGGVRQAARVIRTSHGGDLNWPNVDDTAEVASVITEGATIDVKGITFSMRTLKAFKFSSGFVKASIEFVQDSAFSAPAFIGEMLGIRVARGTNNHFTVGAAAHTSGPAGVATEAISGHTITTGTSFITYTNLLNVLHSVDPAYRQRSAKWMMHDSTLKAVKQLVDGSSRPLWLPGTGSGLAAQPDTLLGYPYIVNQAMATATTATGSLKLILFGDFSKYVIRDVMDVDLVRVNERFIDAGSVAWLTFSRHDGLTIASTAVATTNWPIKALVSPSTG